MCLPTFLSNAISALFSWWKILDLAIVVLSFVFDNYYSIID